MTPIIESNPEPSNTFGLATKGYVWAVVSSISGDLNNVQSVNGIFPGLNHDVIVSSLYATSCGVKMQINGDLTAISGNERLNILTNSNYRDIDDRISNKINPLSSDYSSFKHGIEAVSSKWNSTYSTTSSMSSRWTQGYNSAKSTSAKANSVYASVSAASASWNSAYRLITTSSGNWNGTFETLQSVSGVWNDTKATLESLSGNWNSNYTSTSVNSGNWNTTYTTVSGVSSYWNETRKLLESQMYVQMLRDGVHTKTFEDGYLSDRYSFSHQSFNEDAYGCGMEINMMEYLRKSDRYFDKLNVLKVGIKTMSIAPVGVSVNSAALGFYDGSELVLMSKPTNIERGSRQEFANVTFTFDEYDAIDANKTYGIYLINYYTKEKLLYDFSLPWNTASSFTLTSFKYLNRSGSSFANGKIYKGNISFNIYYRLPDTKLAEFNDLSLACSFRGMFDTIFDVPSSSSSYEADSNGNRVPIGNDYIMLRDIGNHHWHGSSLQSGNCKRIVRGNGGKYVASVGTSLMASNDGGESWSVVHEMDEGEYGALEYLNGKFFASTLNSGIISSSDCTNWATSYSTTACYDSISYGGGKIIACGHDASTVYSNVTGGGWSATDVPSGRFSKSVYGNSKHVAVGSNDNGIWYSSDGAHWIQSDADEGTYNGVGFINGKFIAYGGDSNGISYSQNGATWYQTDLSSGNFNAIAFANGKYVAAGESGLWYSSNLDNWNRSKKEDCSFLTFASGNSIVVAGSVDYGIWYSYDCNRWYRSDFENGTANCLIYDGNGFMAGTSQGISLSKSVLGCQKLSYRGSWNTDGVLGWKLQYVCSDVDSIKNRLQGVTFDFSSTSSMYCALSSLITALGGSVTNIPS